jgi:hypothetical protein
MDDALFDREDDIRAWMREFSALPIDDGSMADGLQLWLKAELLKRWDAQRQAVAPIERAERIHVGICLVGAIVLLGSLWEYVPAPSLTLVFATVLSLMLIVAVAALTLWQS